MYSDSLSPGVAVNDNKYVLESLAKAIEKSLKGKAFKDQSADN